MEQYKEAIVKMMSDEYGTNVKFKDELTSIKKSKMPGYDKKISLFFAATGGYSIDKVEDDIEKIIKDEGHYIIDADIDFGFKAIIIDIYYKETK